MPHWLDKVLDLLEADTMNLRELAKLAGSNPRSFYRGAEMRMVDLRGQDLRGMEFTKLDLGTALIDSETYFDSSISFSSMDDAVSIRVQHKLEPTSNSHSLKEILREAHLLVKKKEYHKAIGLLTSEAERFSSESIYLHTLARAYDLNNDRYNALLVYRDLTEKFPDLPEGWLGLMRNLRITKRFSEAANVGSASFERFPSLFEIRFEFANCLIAKGDGIIAIPLLRDLVRDFPESNHAWARLGAALQRVEQHEEVILLLGARYEGRSIPTQVLHVLCKSLEEQGRYDYVVDLLSRELDENPNNVGLIRTLFHTTMRYGRQNQLLAIIKNLLRQKDLESSSLKNYGEVLLKAGHYDPSLEVFYRALSQFPQELGPWKWLGDALLATERYREAIDICSEAITRHPDTPVPFKWLAEAFLSAGDFDKAKETYTAAEQLFPQRLEEIEKWRHRALFQFFKYRFRI